MKKNQHITPHSLGGWQVKGAGNARATVRTATQKEAISIGRVISQNQHSELVIHGTDGKIREKNSYGNDPYPPKGRTKVWEHIVLPFFLKLLVGDYYGEILD